MKDKGKPTKEIIIIPELYEQTDEDKLKENIHNYFDIRVNDEEGNIKRIKERSIKEKKERI